MQQNELVMELIQEQGSGRETQVQPPKAVWEQFFGVLLDTSMRPTYRLQNMKKQSVIEQRKVVKHHHNFTLEIGDARPPRPAILRMRRLGPNSFGYWVYRPPSKDYSHCKWMLDNLGQTATDRRWLIINRDP
jgi:hypothetical protein